MIKEKTVFILGAGASCPYGYPDGKKLRREIISNFFNDTTYYLRSQGVTRFEIGEAEDKAKILVDTFEKSSTKSIDLFLARNSEFEEMGKHAIIFRIFIAELKSKFREEVGDITKDWYSHLYDKLTDEIVKKNDYVRYSENTVGFVTFNYDRSLEHFLYESVINSFGGISKDKIKEQINSLPIIHVFGQVAGLDWQDLEIKIGYKMDFRKVKVNNLVKELKIIYEEGENPELKKAHKLISEAKNIFFLGFGWARENLELLKIPEILNREQKIYGTALGMTGNEIQNKISIFLDKIPNNSIHIKDLDCLMLLRNYF